MEFLSKWFGATNKQHNKQAIGRDHLMKSAGFYQAITPRSAKTSGQRYSQLSAEGYGNNVIAHRAINMIARGVASVPFHLYEKDKRLVDHPFLQILKHPNPIQRSEALIYTMVGYYLISGNSYLLSVGPQHGQPKELWLMRPDTVEQKFSEQNYVSQYIQRVGSHKRCFDKQAVLHWKTFNPQSEWQGLAPLSAAALSVDTFNEGSRWNLALIQNGGCPSGVLYQEKTDQALTDDQYNRLKQEVSEHYTGALNAGRPLLLEGGLRWQDMSVSPSDMDWQAAKNMSAREIALAFGVPAQLVGIPDSQTYANMAEARLSLWEETIIPLVQELIDHLNGWLAPKFGDGLKVKADLDALPALDLKRSRRMERLNKLDFLTVNEKRDAVGLPPVQNGDAL